MKRFTSPGNTRSVSCQNCFLLKTEIARASRTINMIAPRVVVNKTGLAMFRMLGNKGMTEIWFPPYNTRMAPTRTEGEATPTRLMSTLQIQEPISRSSVDRL